MKRHHVKILCLLILFSPFPGLVMLFTAFPSLRGECSAAQTAPTVPANLPADPKAAYVRGWDDHIASTQPAAPVVVAPPLPIEPYLKNIQAGQTVDLPTGVYTMSQLYGPKVGQDGVTIDGHDSILHLSLPVGIGSAFEPYGASRFTLRNFALIDGPPGLVVLRACGDSAWLDHVTIRGCGGGFITGPGGTHPKVTFCDIAGTSSGGVYFDTSGGYLEGDRIADSQGENPFRVSQGSQIADGLVVKNCYFRNHNPPKGSIHKQAVSLRSIHNVVFTGNTIDGAMRVGQEGGSPASSVDEFNKNVLIANNTFINPDFSAPLSIDQGVSGEIYGNTFPAGVAGIVVSANSQVKIGFNITAGSLIAISSTAASFTLDPAYMSPATTQPSTQPSTQPATMPSTQPSTQPATQPTTMPTLVPAPHVLLPPR